MEQKKKLYPIQFTPETSSHSWGDETYAVADLGIVDSAVCNGWLSGNTLSDVMETYIERISGEDVYGYYGRQFPVAVSTLKIEGKFPVMCHPDDEAAGQRYDALGKKTLLYILDADPAAKLYLGFSREMSAGELYTRCLDGTVRETLNEITPVSGDAFIINPGTVYSASGHLTALCVSEASAISFSLENDEESHIEDAMDLIDYGRCDISRIWSRHGADASASQNPDSTNLLSSPEFSVNLTPVHEPMKFTAGNSFTIFSCISGALSIQVPGKDADGVSHMGDYPLRKDGTVLMPADIEEFFLVPTERETCVIETFIEKREEIDNYINPDTEPFLEGEDYEGLDAEDAEDSGDTDKEETGYKE